MSNFFSLSGDKHHHHHQQQQQDHHNPQPDQPNHNLFLSKNQEIYNNNNERVSFELWQQNYQFHQQQKLHQSQPQPHHIQDVHFALAPSSSNVGSGRELGFRVMNNLGGGGGGRGGGLLHDDGLSCQDCGNQAKRDCVHMRCRTCCKSRGYPCPTHVKSTWIPAARRRERLDQRPPVVGGGGGVGDQNPKRLRDHNPAGGGFELGHFPAELNSPAVFRCVRVSSIDDGDEQLAYQTAVNIGGHVFKGILYDQGPENQFSGGGGAGPSGSQQPPPPPAATSAATTMFDPSIYSPQLSGFMAGTQFFLPPRQ